MKIIESRHLYYPDAITFNKELLGAIQEYQSKGYYVEVLYGDTINGFSCLILGRSE